MQSGKLALSGLLLLALASAQVNLLPSPHVRQFKVGIYSALNVDQNLYNIWRPLVDAMAEAAGYPASRFELVFLTSTGDERKTLEMDYLYGPPVASACAGYRSLAPEFTARYGPYGYIPVASGVQSAPDATGSLRDYTHVCGVILKRKDRSITFTPEGFSNVTVALMTPLASDVGQLHLIHLLQTYGIDVFAHAKRTVVTIFDLPLILRLLLTGEADLGFVGMATLYRLRIRGLLTPEQIDLLEMVDARTTPGHPFLCSTQTLPNYNWYASPWIPQDEITAVRSRLLQVKRTDYPMTGFVGYVNALSDLPATLPILALGQAGADLRHPACALNVSDVFSVMQSCALEGQGYFKVDREKFYRSCADLGVNQTCPTGALCVCKPCKRIPRSRHRVFGLLSPSAPMPLNATHPEAAPYRTIYERLIQASGAAFSDVPVTIDSNATAADGSAVRFHDCQRLRECMDVPRGSAAQLIIYDLLVDYEAELGLNATKSISVSASVRADEIGIGTNLLFNETEAVYDPVTKRTFWVLDLNISTQGIYLVQVRANGKDIDLSPFFLHVLPDTCAPGSIPTADGGCLVIEDGNDRDLARILGPAVAVPVAVCLLVLVLVLLWLRQRDLARWSIAADEIKLLDGLKGSGQGQSAVVDVSSRCIRALYRTFDVNLLPLNAGRTIARTTSKAAVASESVPPRVNSETDYKAARSKKIVLDEVAHLIKTCRDPSLSIVHGHTFINVYGHGQTLCLVEEASKLGNLQDLLENQSVQLDLMQRLQIVKDVASGLAFLHGLREPIVHGGLGLASVLVFERNDSLTGKLGWNGKLFTGQTTAHPHELYQDVLDFGCLMLAVLVPADTDTGLGQSDSQSDVDAQLLVKLVSSQQSTHAELAERVNAYDGLPLAIRSLIVDCLDPVLSHRPEIGEVYHTLVKAVDDEKLRAAKLALDHRAIETDLLDFPPHVRDTLRRGLKFEPEQHEDLTVLFSDVVGFTTISSQLDARDVQDTLNLMYGDFDAAVRKHGLYKLQIIGDAYLIVGNLTEKHADHTARMARMALDMIKIARKYKFIRRSGAAPIDTSNDDEEDFDQELMTKDEFDVNIRIGIHVGPCCATILGTTNPRFTLIGDTMNTASRAESNSLPNRINMTALAAHRLRHQDSDLARHLVARESIRVKGKGLMEFHFLDVPGVILVSDAGADRSYHGQARVHFDTATPFLPPQSFTNSPQPMALANGGSFSTAIGKRTLHGPGQISRISHLFGASRLSAYVIAGNIGAPVTIAPKSSGPAARTEAPLTRAPNPMQTNNQLRPTNVRARPRLIDLILPASSHVSRPTSTAHSGPSKSGTNYTEPSSNGTNSSSSRGSHRSGSSYVTPAQSIVVNARARMEENARNRNRGTDGTQLQPIPEPTEPMSPLSPSGIRDV